MAENGIKIAVSGKGGVGKTTLAALLVRELAVSGRKPVLAVDADPNSCLDVALGVHVQRTIGGIREETRRLAGKGMLDGIAKQELMELRISESLVETDDFDLLAMGRPEGPGCYCFANNVVKEIVSRLSSSYGFVVLDNEAGLENLSRRIVSSVNLLVIVTDASAAGLGTARRLHALAHEMDIRYDRLALVVNRVRPGAATAAFDEIAAGIGASGTYILPADDEVALAAEEGRSVFSLGAGNPVVSGVARLIGEECRGG